jgi:hypothetical protein
MKLSEATKKVEKESLIYRACALKWHSDWLYEMGEFGKLIPQIEELQLLLKKVKESGLEDEYKLCVNSNGVKISEVKTLVMIRVPETPDKFEYRHLDGVLRTDIREEDMIYYDLCRWLFSTGRSCRCIVFY